MKRFLPVFLLILFSFLFSPLIAYADPPCAPGAYSKDLGCTKINTGLGVDLGTDFISSIKDIFGILLSISGGIALLLIIISGYRLIVSGGNPDKVKGAREQLTSAIIGLAFIIFSLVILQLIGVDILRIPGFEE